MTRGLLTALVNGKHVVFITLLISLLLTGMDHYYRPMPGDSISSSFSYFQPEQAYSISRIVNWILLILIAFLLHFLNKQFRICREPTKLFFVLPVLFVSCTFLTDFTVSDSLAVLFFVLSYFPFFSAYQEYNATRNVFNSSLLMSLVTILEPTLCLFIPIFYLGLFQFRSLRLKSFLASLIAFFAPYWLLGGIAFIMERPDWLYNISDSFRIDMLNMGQITWQNIMIFSVTALCILSAFIQLQVNNKGDSIKTRLFLQYSLLVMIFLVLAGFFFNSYEHAFTYLFFIVSTPLLSRYFTITKSYYSTFLFYCMLISYITYFIFRIW